MIYLPEHIPCACELGVRTYPLSAWQNLSVGKAVKRVLFLNLMPMKEVTEMDICRTLARTDVDAQILPIKIPGRQYKYASAEHMERCYLDFPAVEPYDFDRLIITGAPLEQMPFESVDYWSELCQIMHWADEHVRHTLYICWAAQAGLYCHYGIDKHALSDKMFGVFCHDCTADSDTFAFASNLLSGLEPSFPMPQSRHTEVRACEIEPFSANGLHILAQSRESGVGLVADTHLKRIFITGHLEYEPQTLHNEYHRDLGKNLPILPPQHYYDAEGKVVYSWHEAAVTFYRNFMAL